MGWWSVTWEEIKEVGWVGRECKKEEERGERKEKEIIKYIIIIIIIIKNKIK